MTYHEDLLDKVNESILKLKGNPDAEVLFNNLVALREHSVESLCSPDAIKDHNIMAFYAAQVDLLDEILSPIKEVYSDTF